MSSNKVSDVNIETGYSTDDILVEGDDVYYKSGEIANQLGISRDMVRYYTNIYSEYLNVSKTKEGKGGHTKYTGKDLETLELIVTLVEQHKQTGEIKLLLSTPGASLLLKNSPEKNKEMTALLAQNNQYLINAIGELLNTQQQRLFEHSTNEFKDEIDKLSNEVKDLKEICEKQQELLENISKSNELNKKNGFWGLFKK